MKDFFRKIFQSRTINWLFRAIVIFSPLSFFHKLTFSPLRVAVQFNDGSSLFILLVLFLFAANYFYGFYGAWKTSKHKKLLFELFDAFFLIYENMLGILLASILFGISFNHAAPQILFAGVTVIALLEAVKLRNELREKIIIHGLK